MTFERILCPIDFSPAALQGLGFALDLARQADGRVTLLHVVEWLAEEEPRASRHFNVPEYLRYMVDHAQERLRELVADESQTWVEIADVVVFGRAYRGARDDQIRRFLFGGTKDFAIGSAALAVRRSVQRRRLKPLHRRRPRPAGPAS